MEQEEKSVTELRINYYFFWFFDCMRNHVSLCSDECFFVLFVFSSSFFFKMYHPDITIMVDWPGVKHQVTSFLNVYKFKA